MQYCEIIFSKNPTIQHVVGIVSLFQILYIFNKYSDLYLIEDRDMHLPWKNCHGLFTKPKECARIIHCEYSFCRQAISLAERNPCSLI